MFGRGGGLISIYASVDLRLAKGKVFAMLQLILHVTQL